MSEAVESGVLVRAMNASEYEVFCKGFVGVVPMSRLTPGAHDVCACGDYRLDHVDNGAGTCRLNGLGHNGPSACYSFRIAETS